MIAVTTDSVPARERVEFWADLVSRHAFTFDLERRWRHLVVTLPVEWLDGRVARPESLAGAVLRGHPLSRLWASHLAAGVAVASELSPAAGALFARQSVDLLGELLDESHPAGRPPSEAARAAVFASACHVIALEFGNPDLTPAVIARAVGVSIRTLARVFAPHGETVMRRDHVRRSLGHQAVLAPWVHRSNPGNPRAVSGARVGHELDMHVQRDPFGAAAVRGRIPLARRSARDVPRAEADRVKELCSRSKPR